MRPLPLLLAALALPACGAVDSTPASPPARTVPSAYAPLVRGDVAARNFAAVVRRVEPVAERICRAEAPDIPCDYLIFVDNRPGLPPNAYQTLNRYGRPVIGFTVALVADARNRDELALILGHEAAHHIAGHIPRQRESALGGAVFGGILADIAGGDSRAIDAARDFGAAVGARAYSKEFELEADALGTVIAYRAGYDPAVGARYFERVADPGNRFLGTHPPNAARVRVIRETMAALR